MASVNMAVVLGNVGQDPEIRTTTSGTQVANFSVATTKKWTKDGEKHEKTEWHQISVFGKLADVVAKYVKKGSSVHIVGELRTDSWEKDGVTKYKTVIAANSIQLCGSRRDSADAGTVGSTSDYQRPAGVKNYAPGGDGNDEIPF